MAEPADPRVEFIVQLILSAQSPLLIAEIAYALRAKIAAPPPAPARRRRDDLWLLRQLVVEGGGTFPQRKQYDAARSAAAEQALTSHTLLARYGSWWEACSIASAMADDGTMRAGPKYDGGRKRGRAMPKPYTHDEFVGAVRLCAFDLGRRPTYTDYARWSNARCANAYARGIELRLPSIYPIKTLFPGPNKWRRVLAAAAITDVELQKARAVILGLGRDHENGFLALPISEAARVANKLGGSLDWLAGRTAYPKPTADPTLRFSPSRFRDLRDRSPLSPERLADAAGLTISEARRLLTGRWEPTLQVVVAIASLLGIAAADLCERVTGK